MKEAPVIITINLSDNYNEQFRQRFILDDYYMISCKTLNEALCILDIEKCLLIIHLFSLALKILSIDWIVFWK